MIAMARTLFILNERACGTKSSYNGLRLAGALSKRQGFEGNSRPDAVIFR